LRGQSAEELRVKAENDKLRAIWMEKLLAREKMSLKQVEPFLASKQRSAESLLAAFRLTGDKTLLREALEKHPADPQVNYAAYQAFKQELPPDERLQRLEAFKQADPGNSMANYLSAREYFNAGQKERAIEELTAASGKQNMQDYSASYVQNAEEAFLSVGFSSLEAKTLSLTVLEYPQLSEMKALGRNLTDMAKTYGKAGDETSALNASQMAIALGRRVSEPSALSSMIQDLVGAAIERSALDGMNPSAIYDNTGRTVKMRLDELAQHRAAIGGLAGNDLVAYMKSLPEQDQFGYFEKLKISGEFAALNWLKNKQTKP
jgi:tetratricopeptide (TPR) repeat protein